MAPRASTPSVCPPTVMIVAACVSCFLFSVNVSPTRVVTSGFVGIGPTVSDDPEPQLAFAAGFISTPTPTSTAAGAQDDDRQRGEDLLQHDRPRTQRSELSSSDSRSVWRHSEYRIAREEHGERHRMFAGRFLPGDGAGAVPGAVDGDRDHPVHDRARPVLRDRVGPNIRHHRIRDGEALGGGVPGELPPGV